MGYPQPWLLKEANLFIINSCSHIKSKYKYCKSNKHDEFYLLENFGRIRQNFGRQHKKLSSTKNDYFTLRHLISSPIISVARFFEKQSSMQQIGYKHMPQVSNISGCTVIIGPQYVCKINLAIVFVCVHYIRLLLSDYCIKVHAPITGEWIPGKNQDWSVAAFVLPWCQFLRPADIKDIFDHLREPKPLWSDCLVTKIKKRLKKKNIWIY